MGVFDLMTRKVVPGNNSLQIDPAGNVLFTLPHGTFYSNVTQAIANIAATQKIALELESDVHGFTHNLVTNNSRIYAESSGSYEIIFSGIADLAALPANKHLEVWIAVDGTPVTDSNTRVEIPTNSVEMTVAVAFQLDLNAGQYFEIETWGDDTDCRWMATAAAVGPVRPAVPSVIVTAKKISSYV